MNPKNEWFVKQIEILDGFIIENYSQIQEYVEIIVRTILNKGLAEQSDINEIANFYRLDIDILLSKIKEFQSIRDMYIGELQLRGVNYPSNSKSSYKRTDFEYIEERVIELLLVRGVKLRTSNEFENFGRG